MDWQKKILRDVFGWKRADGTRRYRTVYIEIPRKNGKSTFCAGIALYLLLGEEDLEPGAQIYSAAADTKQASIVFTEAQTMLLRSPLLSKRSQVYRRSLVRYSNRAGLRIPDGRYEVLSAEPKGKHGYNAYGIIIDELHEQPGRDLVDALVTSTGSRRQPIVFAITTAGWDRNSICWEYHERAQQILDGSLNLPSFYPVIFAVGEKDDWRDPSTWAKANPSLGIALKESVITEDAEIAKKTPTFENTFRRLHLNQWTEQETRFLPMESWDKCPKDPPDLEALKGRECFGGLDLSQTRDITALVLYWPDDHTVLPFFWIPEEQAHLKELRDGVPYLTWKAQGFVETTPGPVIDYRYIRQRVNEVFQQFKVHQINYDPANATQLALQLMDEDGHQNEMCLFRQGMLSMNEPTKRLEALVVSEQLRHGANPVLRWMATNAVAKVDPSGNVMLNKAKCQESKRRIDGLVALAMAIGGSIAPLESDEDSVYETRGLRTL